MALSILDVAFETGGRSIAKFNVLMSLVSDDMCKYLFQVYLLPDHISSFRNI